MAKNILLLSVVYGYEEILKFYNENEIFFSDLEDAYFTSRYSDKRFGENLIKSIIEKSIIEKRSF